MSLRSIHLVFIAASILLAALTTWWGVAMFTTGRGGSGTCCSPEGRSGR